MKNPAEHSRGAAVAEVLRHSWRAVAPAHAISIEDLDVATPLLYGSGAGGLGWWRIRDTGLRNSPSGEVLHQAYRLQALQAKIHETKIQKLFHLFRAANVEPILIKGWAISRLYPRAGLRPFGDFDLLIRSKDFQTAMTVIGSGEVKDCLIDPHRRISELDDRSNEDLFSRSELAPCGAEQIRVLAPEDHFALLAIHLLKHGAWRPVWLCDIALLLESMPASFDWKLCLGASRRRANWILTATGLAQIILKADIHDQSIAEQARRLPAWLMRRVLREWNAPFAMRQPPMNHVTPMRSYLRHPTGIVSGLIDRWPNPILATISVNGQFNRLPRLPYQMGNLLACVI